MGFSDRSMISFPGHRFYTLVQMPSKHLGKEGLIPLILTKH
jgi:hypothetical protein